MQAPFPCCRVISAASCRSSRWFKLSRHQREGRVHRTSASNFPYLCLGSTVDVGCPRQAHSLATRGNAEECNLEALSEVCLVTLFLSDSVSMTLTRNFKLTMKNEKVSNMNELFYRHFFLRWVPVLLIIILISVFLFVNIVRFATRLSSFLCC